MSTILVVDDSKAMRQLIVHTLNQNQHNVMDINDGHAAMDLLSNTNVDIVVTDKNMPRMDGIKLTKQLRKQEITKSAPILMLATTQTSQADIECSKAAGVTAWLVKPFEPASLLTEAEKTPA